jgi:hypothetical protein
MSEKKSRKKDDRARHWVIIVYPESAPIHWRSILDGKHMPWVESPLHDKDINADGEIKKSHYHVLLMFEGKKSFEQIKAFSDRLNAPIPQKVASVKGLVRYMVHMDNPEKHQYDKGKIIGHGGADVAELLKPTSADRYTLIREMREHVTTHVVMEFCDLFDYAAENRFDDWFPLLCDNCAYIMGQYIKSCRNKHLQGQ